jgi:tryptophanyl-tRNA synthetase
VVTKLAPITEEMKRLQADTAYIDQVLRDGSERAAALAAPILKEVKAAVGYLS